MHKQNIEFPSYKSFKLLLLKIIIYIYTFSSHLNLDIHKNFTTASIENPILLFRTIYLQFLKIF